MKLALIPPVSLLDYTEQTDLQLMLPHLVRNKQYAYTYMAHGRDVTKQVILDNGVAEGKKPNAEELCYLADKFSVSEIVLPDAMGNADKTRFLTEEFFSYAKQYYKGRLLTRPRFQYVLQGTSLADYEKEARWASKHPNIDVIALNRWMIMGLRLDTTEPWSNVRWEFAKWMQKMGIEKPVHLLGGSPEVPDEIGMRAPNSNSQRTWSKNVRSHDTSSPFNFAFEEKSLGHGNVVRRPQGYFQLPSDDFNIEVVEKNITKLKKWCGYDV